MCRVAFVGYSNIFKEQQGNLGTQNVRRKEENDRRGKGRDREARREKDRPY